jgi:6-methylsalicylate decarboxylase
MKKPFSRSASFVCDEGGSLGDPHRFCCSPSRRGFLTGLAAAGAGVLTARTVRAAGPADGAAAGRIDVHHHFSPPAYTRLTEQKKITPRVMVGWSPAKAIEDMDKGGIGSAINSIVGPGVWFGDAAQARSLARDANEYAAKLSSDFPRRFGSFAALPLPDIEGSLREIAYALDDLKADGIYLWTSYGDKWLGDPYFDPVFEELNRRNAVVFVHPTAPDCCKNLVPGVESAHIEYGTDTTRAIVRMVFSGSSRRYPNVRMIFSHAGGTMPFLIGRWVRPEARGNVPKDFHAQVSRFYYDTAQAYHPVPMTALRQVVPVSQIVFGTDYPYRALLENVEQLGNSGVFNQSELQDIYRLNALRLLPRLAT